MNRIQEDEQTFRQQLVALLPRLRRFALSLTGDRAEADDLVQAACERALARYHQYRPGSRLDRWLFAILHHLFIDERRTMRRQKPHLPFEEGKLLSQAKNTMKKLEARLQLGEVARAMRQMGETERMVLSLVCVEGMSYRDAAEIMQVPVGTVMSRLARARKKLHRLIHEGSSGA